MWDSGLNCDEEYGELPSHACSCKVLKEESTVGAQICQKAGIAREVQGWSDSLWAYTSIVLAALSYFGRMLPNLNRLLDMRPCNGQVPTLPWILLTSQKTDASTP
jgi:hypothetical protein